MLVAAGFALTGAVAAISLAALQVLANPSGTLVAPASVIEVAAVIGIGGATAFGLLRLSNKSKR